MAKRRKIPTYKCHKCKKKLGSAATSFAHFQDHPSHRNPKQLKDYLANLSLKKRQVLSGLPMSERRVRVTRTDKYCTECGSKKMPSHNFCGGCGTKA
jgi:hypothetical protein